MIKNNTFEHRTGIISTVSIIFWLIEKFLMIFYILKYLMNEKFPIITSNVFYKKENP